MNLPNKLTLLRVILVPFFVLFLLWSLPVDNGEIWSRVIAAVLFIGAAVTDSLDGKIARKRNLITNFGKFMDPLADKFMIFGAIFGFVSSGMYAEPAALHIATVVAGLIVIFRELAVTSLRLVIASSPEKKVVAASKLGKMKTGSQCTWAATAILEPVLFCFAPGFVSLHILTWVTLAVMTALTVLSGFDYVKTYWTYIDPRK